jgi:hypothetical protein
MFSVLVDYFVYGKGQVSMILSRRRWKSFGSVFLSSASRSMQKSFRLFVFLQKAACYTHFWNLIFSNKMKKKNNTLPPPQGSHFFLFENSREVLILGQFFPAPKKIFYTVFIRFTGKQTRVAFFFEINCFFFTKSPAPRIFFSPILGFEIPVHRIFFTAEFGHFFGDIFFLIIFLEKNS